jgi:uncharacterized small protein (TIGR04563 family)
MEQRDRYAARCAAVNVERSGEEIQVAPGTPDRRKQSLYFPERMLKEIADEAARQDRSLSWLIQKAWKLAREEITRLPGADRSADSGNTGDEIE